MSGFIGGKPLRPSSKAPAGNRSRSRVGLPRAESAENVARASHSKETLATAITTEPTGLSHVETQYIRNLQQQIYYLELENAYLKNLLKKGKELPQKILHQTGSVVDKLRRSEVEKDKIHYEIHSRSVEIESLMKERDQLLLRLRSAEESHSQDKKALSEEIIELRKRLDDCLPEITKKDSLAARWQSDYQDVLRKLRSAEAVVEALQQQVENKGREESQLITMESERKFELDQMLRSFKQIESDITEERGKRQHLQDEINSLRKSLREKELQAKKEKSVAEKVSEENAALIRENSELVAKVSQLDARVDEFSGGLHYSRHSPVETHVAEMMSIREAERQLKQELLKSQELLRMEQLKSQRLAAQISEQENSSSMARGSQSKLQSQLDSLDAVVRSISAENRQLRQDKINLEEKIGELRKMISHKEAELESVKDKLDVLEDHHKQLLRQYQEEAFMQEDRLREFEKLAHQVKDLARTTRHTSSLPMTKSITPDSVANFEDN